MHAFEHSYTAMGSTFRIRIDTWNTVKAPTSSEGIPGQRDATDANMNAHMDAHIDTRMDTKIGALFTRLVERTESIEQSLSRFRSDSELTQLNEHLGVPRTVSSCMKEVLHLAGQMTVWTAGAFNPRILPAMEEIGYHGFQFASLTEGDPKLTELAPANVTLFAEHDDGTISLMAPIDLGGIGKGYAADCLADMIEEQLDKSTFSGYIVDAGGDIVVSGCQSSGEAWTVGVENPLRPGSLAATITPPLVTWRRAAICTSSSWRKSWKVDGRTVHHLIDPLTQMPADTNVLSVTAMASSAAVAETVTKYVFLRGTADAELWLHVDPLFVSIDGGGQMLFTDALAPYISWTAATPS